MTNLCTEDVVVRLTAPQILSSETLVAAGGGAGSRVAASSAAVELGRRLLLAARAGDTPQVLDLMAKGAPFTTDWLGTSPLHLAAGGAHGDTCAVLLRAGVSRDARTKVERTPLHLAASAGHAHVARLLLDAGAAVDCRDMLRMTPLHWAVQRGHADTVAVLLAAGADSTLVSKFNKTPRSLALELRRDDLVRAIDDAVREREAARSVHHLVTQQNINDTPTQEPEIQTFEGIQRIQNIKTNKLKTEKERIIKTDIKSESEPSAAQLLRRHGITLLPADHSSTVLSALQSGRTVVLSDAGKLMLKESGSGAPSKAAGVGAGAGAVSGATPRSVVLTATPVKSPPAGGIKVFTLNNKLLALPHNKLLDNNNKFVTPQPQHVQQVKFVQLSNGGKIVSPGKVRGLRRVGGTFQTAAPGPLQTPASASPRVGPQFKIIMNKSNFTKLMTNATRTDTNQQQSASPAGNVVESECMAVDETETSNETEALRAALAASKRALASLQHELRATRARLAKYEDVQAT